MGKISVKNLDLYYGDFKALKNIKGAASMVRSFWTDRISSKEWM